MNEKEGYIYIFKCIVGSGSDICKIGKTKHFGDINDRMKQHGRTLYYGFVPYTDFKSGNPIATGFKVRNYDESDNLIKNAFKDYQVSNIEIYNIDYDDAIKKIYDVLKQNNQYLDLLKDGYTEYNLEDSFSKLDDDTSKNVYYSLRDNIISKYGDVLPESLLLMLKSKEEFIQNCSSHYKTGNYVDFPNNMVLDLNFNKQTRIDIKKKLEELL